MRTLRLLGVVGFCLGILSSRAWADFYTGFEPPKYEPGPVQGQHSWMGSAVVVTPPEPVIQTQSLRQGLGAMRLAEPPIAVGTVSWEWYFDGNTYVPAGPLQSFGTSIFGVCRRGDDHLWLDGGAGWVDLGFDMPWNRWVPFRVEIDPGTYAGVLYMDENPVHSFHASYGNEVGGLFAGGAGSSPQNAMYLDEIRIVPEPATVVLAAVGVAALRRRR